MSAIQIGRINRSVVRKAPSAVAITAQAVNVANARCSDGKQLVAPSYALTNPYIPPRFAAAGRGPSIGQIKNIANAVKLVVMNPTK